MHAKVNYVLFMALVIILPLFQLFSSPIMVNARKLTSKNAIFSVDLIRRDSKNATLGSISNHHQIKLSSKFYDVKTVQSTVIPDGGAFDMKISIGTPPVEFAASADTGSDLIWVQCYPCQQCLGSQPLLFDPTKSSTDNIFACTSSVCDARQLFLSATSCSSNNNSCMYTITYGFGTGSHSTGVLSTDTVTFPSTSIPDVIFGCGYNQAGNIFGPNSDGIVGLGGGPLSLISQLGSTINYKFSYCLTPPSSGVSSKLNFGLDVTGPGVISTPFVQQETFPTYYNLALNSISIGDTSVLATNTIIIDSGTTYTFLPSNVYDGVKTAVKASIGLTPTNNPNQMLDPCYQTDSLDELNFPGMVFHFSGGDVVLNAENSFVTSYGMKCLAMVPTDSRPYIFGNVAQTNFHIGYDLQAKQVSFAPADCTTF